MKINQLQQFILQRQTDSVIPPMLQSRLTSSQQTKRKTVNTGNHFYKLQKDKESDTQNFLNQQKIMKAELETLQFQFEQAKEKNKKQTMLDEIIRNVPSQFANDTELLYAEALESKNSQNSYDSPNYDDFYSTSKQTGRQKRQNPAKIINTFSFFKNDTNQQQQKKQNKYSSKRSTQCIKEMNKHTLKNNLNQKSVIHNIEADDYILLKKYTQTLKVQNQ